MKMNHELEVNLEIEINSDLSTIWNALVTPELIKEYLFGAEVLSDWVVGSEIVFQGEYSGSTYRDKGVITSIIPQKELIYTYWSGFSGLEDKPENYSLVSYILEPIDKSKVLLKINQKGFKDETSLEHASGGWPSTLEKIKEICES